MPRCSRGLLVLVMIFATGCGSGSSNAPNPDLKVPDVPPGRGAEKGNDGPKETKSGKKT